MGVSDTIDETCRTDFVSLLYVSIMKYSYQRHQHAFFFFFFLNSSIMYTALEQSKYGRAKLNKDNLYCELKGQNMVDCYN